ncbi:MAG: helix-turn-helix domain-containing protein [Clostridiales bacterium]|nr:helix-turn-helix domain-containing protein [Clostridiales bacterium]
MKTRKQQYGNSNIVGKNIERLRKNQHLKQKDFIYRLQTNGLDINQTSYSKLEGQVRFATDREIYIIAKTLGVSIDSLFEGVILNIK